MVLIVKSLVRFIKKKIPIKETNKITNLMISWVKFS